MSEQTDSISNSNSLRFETSLFNLCMPMPHTIRGQLLNDSIETASQPQHAKTPFIIFSYNPMFETFHPLSPSN